MREKNEEEEKNKTQKKRASYRTKKGLIANV
jgi:hypothetical protein